MPRADRSADPIVTAALTLAGAQGWTSLSPATLAKTAKVKPAEAAAFLENLPRAMCRIAAYVTVEAHRSYRHDPRNTPREALFDLLMQRFDVLQRHRAGFVALERAARRKPSLAAAIMAALSQQSPDLLRTAHIENSAPRGTMQRAGLGLIYLAALRVWLRDDSPDLAHTMKALDRALAWAERLMELTTRQTH